MVCIWSLLPYVYIYIYIYKRFIVFSVTRLKDEVNFFVIQKVLETLLFSQCFYFCNRKFLKHILGHIKYLLPIIANYIQNKFTSCFMVDIRKNQFLFKCHRGDQAWLKESTKVFNYSCLKYFWIGYNKNMGYQN